MNLLFFALLISILAIHGKPLGQGKFGEDVDDSVTDLERFHFADNVRLLPAYSIEKVQRLAKLRALPVMKRSDVSGRWGLRPGNRENDEDVTDFRGFHLVDSTLSLAGNPIENAFRLAKLRALPVMKKSIAFGRWGFRPGNWEDNGAVSAFGGFHLVNENRFLAASPIENALRLAKLRALPIMKKSNAFGRWGFRPGKRGSIAYSL